MTEKSDRRKKQRQTAAEEPTRNPRRASFPLVAIGASACGLEAFSNLLRGLPKEPGLALVFIPHLHPTHESALMELLSGTTQKGGLKTYPSLFHSSLFVPFHFSD